MVIANSKGESKKEIIAKLKKAYPFYGNRPLVKKKWDAEVKAQLNPPREKVVAEKIIPYIPKQKAGREKMRYNGRTNRMEIKYTPSY